MTALDYILNGLEAALALERELGVRVVECDRNILKPVVQSQEPQALSPQQNAIPSISSTVVEARVVKPQPSNISTPPTVLVKSDKAYDFVFLHERELSAKGAEMMDKIISALGKNLDSAPIITSGDLPKASIYVVLGALALRKWMPGMNASPGMWEKTQSGADVLVTYSPEYIMRFGTVTPAVKKIKQDMWTSLKAVAQRAAQAR